MQHCPLQLGILGGQKVEKFITNFNEHSGNIRAVIIFDIHGFMHGAIPVVNKQICGQIMILVYCDVVVFCKSNWSRRCLIHGVEQ